MNTNIANFTESCGLMSEVKILATLETKADEVGYLQDRLRAHGITSSVVDMSLRAQGVVLDGEKKHAAMDKVVRHAVERLHALKDDEIEAVLGLGGGTGGEIILKIMRALPAHIPKILITTLPFDPRDAVADNSIVLVPTLVDICGLNPVLRQVLENAAAMTAGLRAATKTDIDGTNALSVAVTALGATARAVEPLVEKVRALGHETTVFHANGYGGAALTRFVDQGAFHVVVDLTPHELTRLLIAGAHVDMPRRFVCQTEAGLPRIVLPGGLNFLGLGEIGQLPGEYLNRPHYRHSDFFTHVILTKDEMRKVAEALARYLNAGSAKTALIVPMGGFSHQDCPGGVIENAELRQTFLDTVQRTTAPGGRINYKPCSHRCTGDYRADRRFARQIYLTRTGSKTCSTKKTLMPRKMH